MAGSLHAVTQLALIYLLADYRKAYDPLYEDYREKRDVYRSCRGNQSEIAALWVDVQNAYDLTEANYRKQQFTMGLIVGSYLWNIADAWLFMPKRTENNWTSAVKTDGHTVAIQMGITFP